MKLTLAPPVVVAFAFAAASANCLPAQQPFFSNSQPDLPNGLGTSHSIFSSLTSSLSSLFAPRLVQTASDEDPYWTTELGKHFLLYRGKKFMDITDHQELGSLSSTRTFSAPSFPKEVKYKKELKPAFDEISDKGPRKHLESFTAFRTRYYKSETGRQSQKWLLKTVQDIASEKKEITVKEFPHSWGQNTVILHVPGRNKTLTESRGVTILGAHQDSTNFFPFLAAPGSDDDGSGTVTIIEALRVLLKSGWQPESDVEWHWYSAEEGGLLGSQEVAASYEQANTKVYAMLQQDMTAFVKAGTEEVVGIVGDFVDASLAEFVTLLVKAYLDIPPVETKIGYAASDHASWSKIGAPSAFAIEATYQNSNLQRIHTSSDRFDIPEYSFPHLLQFVRLSTAFAVELGGWA
ncbi:Zn-dependent exopeptidase [Violaceomyces palustris]|uniref:Zn-dependent exopeptidase n=1 Tax=Violaceomyces palustris TaxID=1673888 RepID=A0ACD0NZL3_9BASI|nr:Zn-dependent exopeptidase [Violaceomyces palustris]